MFFFHIMPYIFHKGVELFHLLSLALSLGFSFILSSNINGYFIDYPWHFHCDFHSYPLSILLDISLFISANFIAIFIIIPVRYYWIFNSISLVLSLRFHTYP